jgi:hypothetical protein
MPDLKSDIMHAAGVIHHHFFNLLNLLEINYVIILIVRFLSTYTHFGHFTIVDSAATYISNNIETVQ